MGHRLKPAGFRAERFQGLARFQHQLSSMLRTLVKTENAWKRQFSVLGVFADPFSHRGLITLYVQQVIRDLKSQAQPLAVDVEGVELVGIGPGDHRP